MLRGAVRLADFSTGATGRRRASGDHVDVLRPTVEKRVSEGSMRAAEADGVGKGSGEGSGEGRDADSGESYSFKPSLRAAVWSFELSADTLHWSRGRYSGDIRYRDIARLRLSYRPMTMQMARYELEIWAPQAPRLVVASSTCRSFIEMQSQAGAYRAFVAALHERIAAAGGTPRCDTGIAPLLYWAGVVILGGTALALLILTLRAVQAGAWGGAAFLVAFFAVFLWQASNFFRRNRPGRYDLRALPQPLMPV
jgi:hypothetical protein